MRKVRLPAPDRFRYLEGVHRSSDEDRPSNGPGTDGVVRLVRRSRGGRKTARRVAAGLLAGTLIFAVLGVCLVWLGRRSIERPRWALGEPASASDPGAEFRHRIRAAFPPGSSEGAMIRELDGEGFEHVPGLNRAVFDRHGLPCRHTWRIDWQATNGALTMVSPRYDEICL